MNDIPGFDALPQRDVITTIVDDLSQLDPVRSICIGGSLARGEGDEHSDVDVYVATDPDVHQQSASLNVSCVTSLDVVSVRESLFAGTRILHLTLAGGGRCDVHVFELGKPTTEGDLVEVYDGTTSDQEPVHLQGRGVHPLHLDAPEPHALVETIKSFWTGSRVIAKALHRDQLLVAQWVARTLNVRFTRLFVIYRTQSDLLGGDFQVSTHAMKEVYGALSDTEKATLQTYLDHPLSSGEAFAASIFKMMQAVRHVGPVVAERNDTRYPDRLEQTVRNVWERLAGDLGYDLDAIASSEAAAFDDSPKTDDETDRSLQEQARRSLVRRRGDSGGGDACLATLARFHGVDVSATSINASQNGNGTSLYALIEAAERLGMDADGYKADVDNLSTVDAPCILHVSNPSGGNRYVVCFGYEDDAFIIGDPETGVEAMPPIYLSKIWESRALLTAEPKRELTAEAGTNP